MQNVTFRTIPKKTSAASRNLLFTPGGKFIYRKLVLFYPNGKW